MPRSHLKKKLEFHIFIQQVNNKSVVIRPFNEDDKTICPSYRIRKTFLTGYSKYLNSTNAKFPIYFSFNKTKEDIEPLIAKYKKKYNVLATDNYIIKGKTLANFYEIPLFFTYGLIASSIKQNPEGIKEHSQ